MPLDIIRALTNELIRILLSAKYRRARENHEINLVLLTKERCFLLNQANNLIDAVDKSFLCRRNRNKNDLILKF